MSVSPSHFTSRPAQLIVVSPLTRAMQTATGGFAGSKAPYCMLPLLRERLGAPYAAARTSHTPCMCAQDSYLSRQEGTTFRARASRLARRCDTGRTRTELLRCFPQIKVRFLPSPLHLPLPTTLGLSLPSLLIRRAPAPCSSLRPAPCSLLPAHPSGASRLHPEPEPRP